MAELVINESWEKFISENAEIKKLLERGATDIADLSANLQTVSGAAKAVSEDLGKLKKEHIDFQTSSFDTLNGYQEDLITQYSNNACRVVAVVEYGEKSIKEYLFDEEVALSIMQGASDVGVFWITKALTENTNLKALSYLVTYGTDVAYGDGDFLVGDGVNKLRELLLKGGAATENAIWSNARTGAIAVAGYEFIKNLVTDKGEYTLKDFQRNLFSTTSSAATYFAWTYINDAIIAGAGVGSSGGPLGTLVGAGSALVASVATYYTGKYVIQPIKDEFTGDKVIDKFKIGDKTYEVPRNGNGENRTFDVLKDEYKDSYKYYEIDGKEYSTTNYKNEIYSDVKKMDCLKGLDEDIVTKPLEKHLSKIRNAKSLTEAKKEITKLKEESEYPMCIVSVELEDNGFDFEEYWKHYHPSDPIKHRYSGIQE